MSNMHVLYIQLYFTRLVVLTDKQTSKLKHKINKNKNNKLVNAAIGLHANQFADKAAIERHIKLLSKLLLSPYRQGESYVAFSREHHQLSSSRTSAYIRVYLIRVSMEDFL